MSQSHQPTQCSATSRRSGERCRRYCAPGAGVCYYHGGRAGQVVAKAAQRVIEAKAVRTLARRGVEPVDDPLDQLRHLAGEARQFLDYCRTRVEDTGDGNWVVVYAKALDGLQRQLVDLAKLLPAQPSHQSSASDFDLDSQIEQLVADVKRTWALGTPSCPKCDTSCSVCASEPVGLPVPDEPLGLPVGPEDAEIVDEAPEVVPEPSEPETAVQRPEKPPTHQRGCRCEPCEAAKAYEPYEPSLTAGLVMRREW